MACSVFLAIVLGSSESMLSFCVKNGFNHTTIIEARSPSFERIHARAQGSEVVVLGSSESMLFSLFVKNDILASIVPRNYY